MKAILTVILIALLTSCDHPPKDTAVKVSTGQDIELSKYYYDEYGNYVFIAKYVGDRAITTTYEVRQGRQTYKKAVVTI